VRDDDRLDIGFDALEGRIVGRQVDADWRDVPDHRQAEPFADFRRRAEALVRHFERKGEAQPDERAEEREHRQRLNEPRRDFQAVGGIRNRRRVVAAAVTRRLEFGEFFFLELELAGAAVHFLFQIFDGDVEVVRLAEIGIDGFDFTIERFLANLEVVVVYCQAALQYGKVIDRLRGLTDHFLDLLIQEVDFGFEIENLRMLIAHADEHFF